MKKNILKSSPFGVLNEQDWKKIGVGALVAVAGALLTYFSQVIGQIDFGPIWTPLVMACWSIIVNILRKLLSGEK